MLASKNVCFIAILFLFFCCFSTKADALQKSNTTSLKKHIKNVLDTLNPEGYIHDNEIRKELLGELRRFYRFNGYQLAWFTVDEPLASSIILFRQLSTCDRDGMNPEDYHVSELEKLQDHVFTYSDKEPSALVSLDIKVTAAYLSYAWHAYNGRHHFYKNKPHWYGNSQDMHLAQYLANKEISKSLKELLPTSREYRKLKAFLAEYRKLQVSGGWKRIELKDEGYLKLGDIGKTISLLKLRLTYTGDISLKIKEVNEIYFDEKMEKAVKNFQQRHGLPKTGVVGKKTLKALNIPLEERIAQLKINLERLRILSHSTSNEYIQINIPEYKLYAYHRRDSNPLGIRVLVGTEPNLTPVMEDYLEFVIFRPSETSLTISNPQWATVAPTVPTDMEIREIEENKSIESINIESKNDSETLIGLLSTNKTDTYSLCLGNPAIKQLFDSDERALSHGSIIIEQPKLLANYLLKGHREWNADKIDKRMTQNDIAIVPMERKVPLFITYHTAWVGVDNQLNFRRDIYHYEENHIKIMAKRIREVGY